jgi:hypothetical protein
MKTARSLKRIAGLLLGVMLFAQAAFALAGCDWRGRTPAEAIARISAPPCHHEDQGPATTVCVAHCLTDMQSLDRPSVTLPVLSDVPVLTVAFPGWHWAVWVFARAAPVPVSSPPPRILFSKFLI